MCPLGRTITFSAVNNTAFLRASSGMSVSLRVCCPLEVGLHALGVHVHLNSVHILVLILQPCTITWHRQKPSHLATVHEADTCVGGRTKESLLFSDCCSWINPPNTRVGSPACNHHVSVSLSRSTRNGCTGTWTTKTNIQELKPKSIRR